MPLSTSGWSIRPRNVGRNGRNVAASVERGTSPGGPSRPPTTAPVAPAFLTPSDSESIPGDLPEAYREVRRSLGRLRANAWDVKHVLSVLWRVVWPCVVAIAALRILSFPLPRAWNPSLVPAPGVSLLDALVFLWAGYYGHSEPADSAPESSPPA